MADRIVQAQEQEPEEIEIDLKALCRYLFKRWWMVFAGSVLGILAASFYTLALCVPLYSASAMVYVRGEEKQSTSLQDLQMGAALTNDYAIILTSRPILETVAQNLELDMNYKALRNLITITNPNETRILKISAQCQDARQASRIVNELVKTGVQAIQEIDLKETYVIEDAVTDWEPVSPAYVRNLVLGILGGIVLSMGILAGVYILDDKIRTGQEAQNCLGFPVLCSIPENHSCDYERDNGKNKCFALKWRMKKSR